MIPGGLTTEEGLGSLSFIPPDEVLLCSSAVKAHRSGDEWKRGEKNQAIGCQRGGDSPPVVKDIAGR
jgi:hypothetical protein